MPSRILIVDDNSAVRGALRRVFDGITGWEVCAEAENGQEGIEQAQQCLPDIIILDLSMPVMNGLETARELRSRHWNSPVVLYTNFCTPQLNEEAIAAGCSAVASKDASVTGLVGCMRSLLNAGVAS